MQRDHCCYLLSYTLSFGQEICHVPPLLWLHLAMDGCISLHADGMFWG